MLPTPLKGAPSCADTMSALHVQLPAPEQRVPADPLRAVRALTTKPENDVAQVRRPVRQHSPSIPPEQLLRALLLQVLYTVRSERLLMEELNYNLRSAGSWA